MIRLIILIIGCFSFYSCTKISQKRELTFEQQQEHIRLDSIMINIDSLFLQFDTETFNQNKEEYYYEFYIPDSSLFIKQGEYHNNYGYWQSVYFLDDSLLYDEYSYFPNGKLKQKSTNIKFHNVSYDDYIRFDSLGNLKAYILYEKPRNMNILDVIQYVEQKGFNFFKDEITFSIDYLKEDVIQDTFLYKKYKHPILCIQFQRDTIRQIYFDSYTGEILNNSIVNSILY